MLLVLQEGSAAVFLLCLSVLNACMLVYHQADVLELVSKTCFKSCVIYDFNNDACSKTSPCTHTYHLGFALQEGCIAYCNRLFNGNQWASFAALSHECCLNRGTIRHNYVVQTRIPASFTASNSRFALLALHNFAHRLWHILAYKLQNIITRCRHRSIDGEVCKFGFWGSAGAICRWLIKFGACLLDSKEEGRQAPSMVFAYMCKRIHLQHVHCFMFANIQIFWILQHVFFTHSFVSTLNPTIHLFQQSLWTNSAWCNSVALCRHGMHCPWAPL